MENENKTKLREAKIKMMYAIGRTRGYSDCVIEKAIIMHALDGKSFFDKEFENYLTECDDCGE